MDADITKLTIAELEALLETVFATEDIHGRPDVHTEDWIKDEIARRKTARGLPVFYAEGPFADDD